VKCRPFRCSFSLTFSPNGTLFRQEGSEMQGDIGGSFSLPKTGSGLFSLLQAMRPLSSELSDFFPQIRPLYLVARCSRFLPVISHDMERALPLSGSAFSFIELLGMHAHFTTYTPPPARRSVMNSIIADRQRLFIERYPPPGAPRTSL